MIDIDSIFKYKVLNVDKLLVNGFVATGSIYVKNFLILEENFRVEIIVGSSGLVDYKVYEIDTNEEYVLVHVSNADGSFVTQVRKECEKLLSDISNDCFDLQLFKSEQTQKVVDYITNNLSVKPKFPWSKNPNYATFHAKENDKWFAIVVSISKTKLGLDGEEEIEIMNLKALPEEIEEIVDKKVFFPAYHMNKKHWFTICLDGRISNEQIYELIRRSYELVAKK
ncbi:MmcQ/YjbR family DNA-binding protein [Actinomyces sp. zg-332]|uniref:MmcQ/YjbR family DNA-binding protein n=1 Tax=Actinomyces sp. zg-332 TaxID=2708340 RepID=UPI001423354E|nr:MmcQ/YjbR family DNA-binding protein [Actinomyces sp. zg-332]QPK93598.1 MmcQ/YjbR family DNA-binding protein [Actinomyces sp. zg-332]